MEGFIKSFIVFLLSGAVSGIGTYIFTRFIDDLTPFEFLALWFLNWLLLQSRRLHEAIIESRVV